jgi:tRNA threonylcarbamoyladenosine biosynthesis protein TsaB
MKSLSIDTSFEHSSLALQIDEEITEICEFTPKTHSQFLLPALDKMLREAKIKLVDLDFIAFGCGPGSFTSIRFAASVVQGIAYGAKLNVVSISSLAAIALEAFEINPNSTSVFVGMDARIDEVYWAVYQRNTEGILSPVVADILVKPEEIVFPEKKPDEKWFGVGNAWDIYRDVVLKNCPSGIEIKHDLFPRAIYIAKLALLAYSKGSYSDWHAALPVYLRDKVASFNEDQSKNK